MYIDILMYHNTIDDYVRVNGESFHKIMYNKDLSIYLLSIERSILKIATNSKC